jgi:hypothetical protein
VRRVPRALIAHERYASLTARSYGARAWQLLSFAATPLRGYTDARRRQTNAHTLQRCRGDRAGVRLHET